MPEQGFDVNIIGEVVLVQRSGRFEQAVTTMAVFYIGSYDIVDMNAFQRMYLENILCSPLPQRTKFIDHGDFPPKRATHRGDCSAT